MDKFIAIMFILVGFGIVLIRLDIANLKKLVESLKQR